MKLRYKNILFLIFATTFVCALFALTQNIILAAELEVDYPVLATGAKITPTSTLTEYLKYVFDFGIGLGFAAVIFSLAWAGVLYFLSPAIPSALAKAKDRVSGALSGLLILVLFYLIITTINPYLAIFRMGKLEPVEIPEFPEPAIPGVAFYRQAGCSGESEVHSSSIADLGDKLRNNVHSVGMRQDSENKIYYVSVLYDVADFWGKCKYVDPNAPCSNVENFAASASVHEYDFSPEGEGVYIYRKPFTKLEAKQENKNGGYLAISNSQIRSAGIAILNLSRMRFTGNSSDYNNPELCTVPEYEQDCAKYNKKGECEQRICPALDKKNISSIEIKGDYAVLLVYFAPGDPRYGPWSYCQEYASSDDINKIGPQNIKWDAVRSRNQDPNWMVIIPIKG